MDWLPNLFNPNLATPRKVCSGLSPEWITVHTASDLLIWLAYLSIPLILLVSIRRNTLTGLRMPVVMFALFILACGTTHLIEAMMFEYPVYYLSGLVKLVTAVVSWLTVFLVVPVVPKLLARLAPGPAEAAAERSVAPPLVYALAILVGVVVVLLRYSLNGMMGDLHPFHVPMLGVVLVAWYGGFRPGVVTLAVVTLLIVYLFLPPENSFQVERLADLFGIGLFLFAGLGVCVLGQLQQSSRRRLLAQMNAVKAANTALADEKRATDRAMGQLDALVGNAPYAIAFFDPELRFLRVNESLAAGTGLTVAAHFGKSLLEARPDAPPDLIDDYRKVLAGGPPIIGRVVAARGGAWEVSAFGVPLDDGRLGLGVIAKDVTERHTASERIKESEGRLRAMADGIPQLAWMARPDGHIFWYNRRWHDYTGTTPEEMDGWGWQTVHDPVELKRVMVTWPKALATGEPFEDTFPLRRYDGQMRWHLTRAIPTKDADGNVLLWFGTNTDITDQREMADALAESEAYTRGVLDNSPDCIKVLNPDGRLIEFNDPGLAAMGLDDITPLLGKSWADLWPEEGKERVRQAVAAAAAGAVDRFSGWCPTFKGEAKFWDVIVAPIPDASGNVVRLVGVSRDVTDQKRAEERVKEAKEYYEEVVNSLPVQVTVIEQDGRIVSVNHTWRQFGIDHGLLPGHHWQGTSYFTPATADGPSRPDAKLTAGIKSLLAGERTEFNLEYHSDGIDGERYFHMRANRFRGDGAARVVVTHENVTDRVVAERGVREQANQQLQLTEGMPFLMWACRPTGECDYLSRQWVEYTGGHLSNQLGYGWLNALHPDDRAKTDAAWQAAVAESAGYDVEFRIRRHDGEYRWFSVRGIPLRDNAGRIVKWYGSCADIDDRKRQAETLERLVTERTAALHQANAELVQQQAFVDAILDNVAEGIVACDTAGRLKLFNAATRQMHALPAEPLASDQWADHYHLFESDGITPMPTDRVPLVRAWQGEVVKDAEMVIRPADPTADERFVMCSGQPLRTPAGEPFGAVVSMRDMTQRREYERQLLRTTAALESSNDDLEKFAYIASHDLQEPLRKIQAFGDRLATKFREPLAEQGKDYLDRILDSATRMRRMIEDLLAFSRVNTRTKKAEEVDLGDVVRGVLSDLSEQVARTGGKVEVGPLPTLPADAGQLRQVFQNLIGNALKFHRPDAPPLVRITAVPFSALPPDPARRPGDGWRITLADNGIGFEPQHADRIFELFQRLHGRSKFEGTGLGLAIVRKIVNRHGGSIRAHSIPGSGATFTIDWPSTSAESSP